MINNGSRFSIWLKCAVLTPLSFFYLQPSTLFAQGALTPPGTPAPTMKSLAQIEPRTPISSAPFVITNSGSYYLTTNVTVTGGDAITISTNGVTLDLSGFTISSTAASATGFGIRLATGFKDITIFNGRIVSGVTNNGGVFGGSGFLNGIYYSGNAPVNVRVTGVSVSGCLSYGILLGQGESTVVEGCTVRITGSYGIYASTIKGCVAKDCGSSALVGDLVVDSRGESASVGAGIYATSSALNCYGIGTSGANGVYADTAQNCYGSSIGSGGSGVYAVTAQNCYGSCTGDGYGVYATDAQNCYGFSTIGFGIVISGRALNCSGFSGSGTGTGIYAIDGGALIGCTAKASGVGISAGNDCTIKDCTATGNSSDGIYALSGCTITGCTVRNNAGDGIQVSSDCFVLNNMVSFNSTASVSAGGIHVTSHRNRIEGNHVMKNNYDGILIDASGTNNFILKNTAGYNAQFQYRIGGAAVDGLTGPNEFAPLQTLKNSTNSWANFQLQ